MNKKQKNKPAIIPQNQKQKQKFFADAKKRPPPPVFSPPEGGGGEEPYALDSFSSAGDASSPRPFQPRAHRYLSWSPGTLHESLLHSTYHRLPCFIVIYVCVCLPKGLRASRAGDRVCVPSASPPWCLIGCLTHTHLLN